MSGTTRKHYEKAAKIVRDQEPRHRIIVAQAFAALFDGDNVLFNHDRFMGACGLVSPRGTLAVCNHPATQQVSESDQRLICTSCFTIL